MGRGAETSEAEGMTTGLIGWRVRRAFRVIKRELVIAGLELQLDNTSVGQARWGDCLPAGWNQTDGHHRGHEVGAVGHNPTAPTSCVTGS